MKTFAQALCEHFGCAREDYRRVALKHCLYPHARWLARLFPFPLREADLELIEAAGVVTSEEQLSDLLRDYWHQLHLYGGFLAKRLKLRVSGNRLRILFVQVMRGATEPSKA